ESIGNPTHSIVHNIDSPLCKMKRPTNLLSRISSDGSDSDTPEKCRSRRRRRIHMRRMRIASVPRLPYSSPHFHLPIPQHWLPTPSSENPMPEFGCISIQGLAESMDDAVSVKEEFFRPDIVGGRTLHFFSVYDGHGGSHVVPLNFQIIDYIYTSTHMHYLYLTDTKTKQENEEVGGAEWEDLVRVAIQKSFKRMDQAALSTCALGCQPESMDLVFLGSAALVALVSGDRVVVANCGDSRAVLCRDGRPVPPLPDDKPQRPDELERIRAAGGKLIHQNGVRVYGILNMSRSLGGDNLLKRVTTSQPEISITEREGGDECLILASDGIWDVISDDLACRVASACLREGSAATAPRSRYSDRADQRRHDAAAAILCRLALARGSHDNISVIVVDLRRKAKGRS
ncbi:hypothetical protein CISIN_1g035835mg, partial [Citrus sinensis]